ncbi:MAG: ATP-binding protein, partial [Erysipelotrichaceae bacterium]|nr:ATP-binding protein [Erysipelotrichaceae bacterium]
MIIDLSGENKNIEYKREIPKKHKSLLKDIIAFANTTGGKVIIGVEDKTHSVYGVDPNEVEELSDSITNM